ncbi:MAG: hypothetical protein Alpg2KO_08320 [Alphaproteobacteria bacterium]
MQSFKFSRRENSRGASGLSYGLVVGLISIVALASVTTSGSSVNSLFTTVSDTIAVPAGQGGEASQQSTPQTQTASCGGSVPGNATANQTSFTQTWDGSAYAPASLDFFHNDGVADEECEYACDSGFSHSGGQCVTDGDVFVDFTNGTSGGSGASDQPRNNFATAIAALPPSGGTVSVVPGRHDISISANSLYEVVTIANADNKTVVIEGNDALIWVSYTGSENWDGFLGVGGSPNSDVTVRNLHMIQTGNDVFSVLEKGYGNDSGVAAGYNQSTGSFTVENSSFWFEDTVNRYIYSNGNGTTTLQNSTVYAPGNVSSNTYINYGSGTVTNVTHYTSGHPNYLSRSDYITNLGYTP